MVNIKMIIKFIQNVLIKLSNTVFIFTQKISIIYYLFL